MAKKWIRITVLVTASLLLAAAAIVAYLHSTSRRAQGEERHPASLQAFDLETFKKTFDAGADGVRVVAMLSPT